MAAQTAVQTGKVGSRRMKWVDKRVVFTMAGVLLTGGLALGSWLFTGDLLEIKESSLLSARDRSGFFGGDVSGEELAVKEEADRQEYPKLSEEEIAPIIANWESGQPSVPHFPMTQHLHFEDAVEIGEKWLGILSEEMALPDVPYPYDNVNAYLVSRETSQEVRISDQYQYYSCWSVRFDGAHSYVWMNINAVTGEVWQIQLASSDVSVDYDAWCTIETLDAYLDAAAIEADRSVFYRSANALMRASSRNRFVIQVNTFTVSTVEYDEISAETETDVGLSIGLFPDYGGEGEIVTVQS